MKLSVSMIVKNEESCLTTCLESVIGADELVVVDTGSNDRTMEIAVSYGAKIAEFPWVDDFSAARNYSLEQCTGDWILIIDADEVLEPNGISKIREAIDKSKNFKTVGVRCVSSKGGENHISPRVFRRCPEIFWKGAIHNYLSLMENNPSDIVITYGYSEAHKNDPDRALRILTKVLKENPVAIRETYYLAREYFYRKDYKTAISWYQDYLTRATWAPEMADAWLMIARCKWFLNRGQEARMACLNAIQINADFKEALLFMAEMSGPNSKRKWLQYATIATNKDVLFIRTV